MMRFLRVKTQKQLWVFEGSRNREVLPK
ncbi:hypothetical protein SOVF_060470, partial [Spinacia oleracea]